MKIRYSFERGAIDVSRLRVITLRFSNFIFIFLRHFYDEKFYNVNILRIFIYLQDKRVVGEFAIIIFSRVICKFASENVAKRMEWLTRKFALEIVNLSAFIGASSPLNGQWVS